ncbi:MAG: amidohydrolase family protein [Desulfobacterales bacterium]|nr:amidohydrolase family protein [Desulfobacterales bacterium]
MIIDWQHHLTPEPIWRERGGKADETVLLHQYGKLIMPLYESCYLIEKHLEDMAQAGIDMAVLSETPYQLDECRLINDTYAKLMQKYPDHIVGLAPGLPLLGKAAFDELDRAINGLGLKGVVISPQRKGVFLDSSQMWPFYEKVSTLDVPIFVHISPAPRGFDSLNAPYNLNETMAREFDLATAIARICIGGVLEDFPDLKFVFAHLGGGIAAIRERIEQYMNRWGADFWTRGAVPAINKPFSHYFEKVYVDTAGYEGGINALRCALTGIHPNRILFGTDYPFDFVNDTKGISRFIQSIQNLDLDADAIQGILGGNAAALLKLN